jgi:YD repeat-containing protein
MKRILLVLVLVLGFVPFLIAQDFGGSEGVSTTGAYSEYVIESLKVVYQDASEYIVNIPGGYRMRWAESSQFFTPDQLMVAQNIPNGTITAIYAGFKDSYIYDASGNVISETHAPAITYNAYSTSLNITVSDGDRARIIIDLIGGSPAFNITKEAL